MSYQSAKYQNLVDSKWRAPFSSGIIDNQQSYLLPPGNTPYGRNFRVAGWSVYIRPGYSLFSEFSGTGDFPYGIGSYLRADSANDVLVVRFSTDATHRLQVIAADGTSTPILTAALIPGGQRRMTFTNIGEVMYCFNGQALMGKLSGTTYTTVTAAVPSNFAPSYSVVFNDTHWASGWSTNANLVYRSVPWAPEDFTWTGSGTISFNEQITWLIANLESLFFFTKNSISVTTKGDITQVWTDFGYAVRAMQAQEGATCNASIVWAGNSVFFLTPSNKIMKIEKGISNLGFDTVDVSHRKNKGIENLMGSLDPDQSDSFGYYVPSTNLCKWYVKSYGATFNDTCIIYSTNYDTFYVDTNKNFFDGIVFNWSEYTCSTLEKKVFQDEVGQTDDDQAIQFDYQTKAFAPSGPTLRNELWEARFFWSINELAELTQEIYVDGNLVSTKVIDADNIPLLTGWIWSEPVWSWAVAEYDPDAADMFDVYLITTKGQLQKKWFFFVFRYTNSTLAWKAQLRNLQFKSESLTPWAVPNQS